MSKKISRSAQQPSTPLQVHRPSHWARYTPLLLIPLFVTFYYRLLSGNAFLWEDITELNYPLLRFAVDSLREGVFPFWTPYVFAGMPFFSDPQTLLFYPPFWGLYLVSLVTEPGGLSYTWFILLHILTLGFGIYALCRDHGLVRAAALFASIACMFCGFLSLHVMHTLVYVIAWFPWAFLFLRRSFRKGELGDALLAGLFLGVSLLGGYPQYSLHIMYFLFFWSVFSIITDRKTFPVKRAAYFGIAVTVALGMAAIQFLPSFEHVAQSVREKMTFDESSKGSLSLAGLITFLAPKFFGWIAGDHSLGSPYWGYGGQAHFFWETAVFIGITPLLLVARSMVSIRQKKDIAFFAVMSAILLLLALGNNGPLYGLVFHLAPGFKGFRIPGRFSLLLSFSLIMLAGFGLDLLFRGEDREKIFRKVLWAVAGSLGGIGIIVLLGGSGLFPELSDSRLADQANRSMGIALLTIAAVTCVLTFMVQSKSRHLWTAALVLIAFCELYSFGSRFASSPVSPTRYFERFDLAQIRNELRDGSFRIQSRFYQGPNRGEMLLPRNLGNVKRIPLVEGYNQLQLQRFSTFVSRVNQETGFSLINAKYVKVPGQYSLMRNEPVPRFYLASQYRVVDGMDQGVEALNSESFVPGRTVILEQTPPLPIDSAREITGSVRVIEENANRIELEVESSGNALLAASEVYYPAWKASVNGKEVPILPANLLFRAIPVEKGKSRVIMEFRSPAFARGALISGMTLALVAATFVVLIARRPKRGNPAAK